MTTQHNPDEVARLIAEAREDDARMTRGPWIGGADAVYVDSTPILESAPGPNHEADCVGIARTRNNLRAMADQLEAAGLAIERLTRRVRDQDEELTAHAERGHRQLMASMAGTRLTTERDKLQAELEAARREVAEMRPVVEAAERYRDNGACYAGIIPAVDAYRAARDKAGG